ncbi:MAG: LacI family DNA-binding transcriptional regulator [Candidatus Nanopelagicales bacterium]
MPTTSTEPTRRRPTLHDVAARAGVSKSLVSLALRNSPKVSPASRAAILTAAEELGYRPNRTASSLVQQRTHTIGVHILDLHNPVFAEILDGVHEAARQHEYSTLLVTGNADRQTEKREITRLLESRVEGLILIAHRLSDEDVADIAAEVPTVVVTWPIEGIAQLDSVSGDDALGMRLGVDHLVALGHQRITHLSGGDNRIAHARQAGYEAAMAAHGLAPRIVSGGFTEAAGYAAAREAVGPPRPTALVVANDLAAIGALAAMRELGVNVPGDISIVGYDGMRLLESLDVTTVTQPLADMGRQAANLLIERINQPGRPSVHSRVATGLVPRGSSGPCALESSL